MRAGSPQNVTAEPSSCGANTRTSGAIVWSPNDVSFRSLTTDGRSRPTVWVMPGAVKPSAMVELRSTPPTSDAASSTVTFRPAFAR